MSSRHQFVFCRRSAQALPSAHGRVVVALEGGYNLTTIAAAGAAVVRALRGEPLSALPRGVPGDLADEPDGDAHGHGTRTRGDQRLQRALSLRPRGEGRGGGGPCAACGCCADPAAAEPAGGGDGGDGSGGVTTTSGGATLYRGACAPEAVAVAAAAGWAACGACGAGARPHRSAVVTIADVLATHRAVGVLREPADV